MAKLGTNLSILFSKLAQLKLRTLFSIIRITPTLEVLCKANPDNYFGITKIHFGYINAGKSQIFSIFWVNGAVGSHFVGNVPKIQEIWGKIFYKSSQMVTLHVAIPE